MFHRRIVFIAVLGACLGACGSDQVQRAGQKCDGGAVCETGTICFDGECRPDVGTACDDRVAQCVPAGLCQAGTCKGVGGTRCDTTLPCASSFTCEEGTCAAGPDGECGDAVGVRCATGLVCRGGHCRIGEGGECDDAARQCVDPLACSGGVCRYRPGEACSHEGTCAQGYECVSGTCRGTNGSPCTERVTCDRGLTCEAGHCRGTTGTACVDTNDCASGWACDGGRCLGGAGVECIASTECVTSYVCHAGKCAGGPGAVCDDAAPCAPGGVCQGGVCLVPKGGECGAGQECAFGLTCVDHRCRGDVGVACLSSADCASGLTCENEVCRSPNGGVCGEPGDCLRGLECVEQRCRGALGAPCGPTAFCGPSLVCEDGTCLVAVGGSCTASVECAANDLCEAGLCVVPNGGACLATAECASKLACEAGTCLGVPGAGCGSLARCEAALTCVDGTCRSPGGGACVTEAECLGGYGCEGSICKAGPAGTCSDSAPCEAGLTCENGTCREPTLGACNSDAECPSLHRCAEGRCLGVAGKGCSDASVCAPGLSCAGGECAPTLDIPAAASGDEATPSTVTLTLSAPAKGPVTVAYTVAGTASEADHPLRAGSITIPAGQTRYDLRIAPVDDAMDEPDETIVLTFGTPTNAFLGANATLTYTILDDDLPPIASITAPVQEIAENTPDPVQVEVSLSAASAFTVKVTLAPADGTATYDVDYRPENAVTELTFAPGETKKTFALDIVNDNVSEGPETVVYGLSNPDNARLAPDPLTLTILDDEPLPVIQFIGTATDANEGDTVQVEVKTNVIIANPITVTYTVSGTADAPADYTAPRGTATITGGTRSALITIATRQDALDEDDETVVLTLADAQPGSLGTARTHTVRILDDDAPPSVQFGPRVPLVEEAAGQASFDLVLSAPSGRTVKAKYAVAGDATNPADHDLTDGEVTFAPGETKKTVAFHVVDDQVVEPDERVNLVIAGASNATVGKLSYSFVGIEDDDKGRFLNVEKVAVGKYAACAIVDGEVRCWGSNGGGILGDGTNPYGPGRDIPKPVPGLRANVSSLCVADSYACATGGGAVTCWGYGNPAGASAVPGAQLDATDVACGLSHTCAVIGGALECWGRGDSGQLGNGNTSSSATPVAVVDLPGTPTKVALAGAHSFALVNGALYCWGATDEGGCLGTAGPRPTVSIASGVTDVSAGFNHTCAVVNGALQCWGRNDAGQLGAATPSYYSPPVTSTGLASGVTAVSAGYGTTCAIQAGKLRCFGGSMLVNDDPRNGAFTPQLPWNDPDLDGGVSSVSNGSFACAVKDTRAKCFGYGTGIRAHGVHADLARPDGVDVVGIPATYASYLPGRLGADAGACAGTPDGLTCFGAQFRTMGIFGDFAAPPTLIHGFAGPVKSQILNSIYLPQQVGDRLLAWGSWDPIPGFESGVTATNFAQSSALVLQNGGVRWFSADPANAKTILPAGSGATSITSESYTFCAAAAGKVYCWSDGSTNPIEVPGLPNDVKTVTIGGSYWPNPTGLALTQSGKVWTFVTAGALREITGFTAQPKAVAYVGITPYVLDGDALREVGYSTVSSTPTLTGLAEVYDSKQGYLCGRGTNGRLHCAGNVGPYGYGGTGYIDLVPVWVMELRRP